MKIKLLLLFVVLFSFNSNAQDIQLVNKIVGNTDPANYYIGHFPVSGSDGLDLHWYGGIRFGDNTSNSVMQITNGNVGIGTTTPRAKLDVASDISNGQLGTVFGRLPEGDTDGTGTFLGVKGYSTQGAGDVKSFSIVHDFYGQTNNSINFYRGSSILGGFMTFCTSNNIEKMRITENGNVGIGTTTPQAKLDVNGAVFLKGIPVLDSDGTSSYFQSNAASYFQNMGNVSAMITSGGNFGIGTTTPYTKLEVVGVISSGAGPSASNLGMEFGGLLSPSALPSQIRGVIGALNNGTGISAGSIGYQPRTGVSASHIFFNEQVETVRITSAGNVGIGTTTPDQKLTVNGTIHSKEIIVDTAITPDYVFQKYYTGKSTLKSDYVMPTLAEIESFTKKNHHLPNVPSAQEVQQNGVSLGEMSNVLLQKVEELTLYAIEQQKKLEEQNKTIATLAARLASLEKK